MNIEMYDWKTIIREIAENSELTFEQIGYEAGIANSALAQLYKKDKPADPKHSEGQELILLYYRYCDGELPIINRSHDVICMACQRLRPRKEIMRIRNGVYRCVSCIEKAKHRKGVY